MWGMLFRIVVALAMAFFVSALVGERLSVSGGAFLEPGILGRIVERAWSQIELSWPFVLFGVALAEVFKIRSLIYYLAAGSIAAIAAVSFDQGVWDFDLAANWLRRWRDGVLTSGVLGGLVYWMTHGYKAGWPAPTRETVSREPMAALLGTPSNDRGWLAGAVSLAAVAGLAWWTLDEHRFNDKPVLKAESEVSTALSASGYPWAKLKIIEDAGQVVGLAPDDTTRKAAFEKAKQVAAPLIGATGVMTSLEDRLTSPDPAAIAAAQAAARRTAEAEAAKRKSDEEAKRITDAEVKRKADEQARRVAANDAETKRKAEDARRLAVATAAEAEAKRKAEDEAKRAAAELEVKRVAAEADAKRKAEEDAKRLASDAEAKRVAAETEVKRIAAEQDAKRIATETEAKRKSEDDAKRKAEDDAKRVASEAEAAKRVAAEAEAVKRKAELEAKMAEAKAKRATDDAAKRLAAAMADKKADIPAKVAAVPAGAVPAKPAAPVAATPAPPATKTAAGLGAAVCAAEPQGVISGTRIALKRSDAVLTAETNDQLDRLAQAIKSCGNVDVRLSGFSTRGFDRRAKADHSRMLAARVADELARRGIPKTRLQTAGLGTPSGDAASSAVPGRRVELAVLAAAAKPTAPAPTAAAAPPQGTAAGQPAVQACTSDPAALRLKFGSSQDQPGGGYRAEVDRIAKLLLACGNARFVIEGHTDATGTDALNLRLSQRRADVVTRALIRRGVPEARITATGIGSAKPLDASGTPVAKAANRRVDVVILSGPSPAAAPAANKK